MLVSRLCLLSSSLGNKRILHRCATLSHAQTLFSMHNLMVAKPLHTHMLFHNVGSYTVLTLSNIVEFLFQNEIRPSYTRHQSEQWHLNSFAVYEFLHIWQEIAAVWNYYPIFFKNCLYCVYLTLRAIFKNQIESYTRVDELRVLNTTSLFLISDYSERRRNKRWLKAVHVCALKIHAGFVFDRDLQFSNLQNKNKNALGPMQWKEPCSMCFLLNVF